MVAKQQTRISATRCEERRHLIHSIRPRVVRVLRGKQQRVYLGVGRWLGNHQPRTHVLVRPRSHHRRAKFAKLHITGHTAQRVHIVKQVVINPTLQHISRQPPAAVRVVGVALSG